MFGWRKRKSIASEGVVTTFGDGQPYRPDISAKALVRRNTSWVYAMIDTNAKAVAQSTLRLFVAKPTVTSKSRFRTRAVSHHKKNYLIHKSNLLKFTTPAADVEEVLEHPLIDLINRVNGIQNRFDLFYLTASSKDATGNAYWLKNRNGLAVNELWPLQPQYVWARADKRNFISHYEYGRNVTKIKIPVKDMVHFRYPSINQPFLGVGPLEAAVVAADLYMSMNTFETAMFRNGGNPDTLLTYPKDVTVNEDEKKRIRFDWRRFQRPGNAGGLAIATGGADIKPFSLSPKEMAFLKGREWSLKELAGIFGVPMSFLQDEGVSRANADVAERGYMRRTIAPRLTMNEETLNQELAPEFDENLFFAYDNPVPQDKEFRLQEQKTHIETKYASINEEREIDGKEPVPWGDAPPEPPDITPSSEDNETDKAILIAMAKAKFPALETPSANFIPTEFVAALVEYFERMGRDINAQAAQAQFKGTKVEAGDIVGPWFKMDIWDERLKNVFLPFVRATFLIAGQRAIETIDTTATFNDGAAIGLAEKRIGSIREINRTTQKIVRQAVADGILAGEGAEPIQRRIRAVFSAEDIGRKRALLIGRTETIWAHNQGAIEAYKQSGVVKQVEWITAADERVCEWCGPMDGRIQTLGMNFWDMGEQMTGEEGGVLRFNFEAIEHPPLHPQCLTGDSLILPVGRIAAVSKRWYDGEVITIRSSTDRPLTCTPNHPILTPQGYRPANVLNIGSEVVGHGFSKRETFADWNNIQKPTRIKDICEAFLLSRGVSSVKVPLSAPDFHGDGTGSKVAIIGSDGLLGDSLDSFGNEQFLQSYLKGRHIRRTFLNRLSVLAFGLPCFRDTFSRLVGSLDLFASRFWAHLSPLERLGFALCSDMQAPFLEDSADDTTRDAIELTNPVFAVSAGIQNSDFGRQCFSDTLTHFSVSKYKGYVYNLETSASYYISNGLSSHNCRCSIAGLT